MNSPLALSPVHDALSNPAPVGNDGQLTLGDLSLLPRAGVKGPAAADWLAAFGLTPPGTANSWRKLAANGLIARLGRNEFLIDGNAQAVDAVSTAPRTAGVYPVRREDAAFAIGGERVGELLLQTCNVDFRSLDADRSRLVMTSMIGVAVTVINVGGDGAPCYRLWCDGTYGHYLWTTLAALIGEITETGGATATAARP